MNYISKGMVLRASTEDLLFVTHCGAEFQLTGLQASLWLNGRFEVAEANEIHDAALQKLHSLGLIELIDDTIEGIYRALTRCILVPAQHSSLYPLTKKEKTMLRWLTEAGIHLTMSELVYLNEHNILPSDTLLGALHRQDLTELIYTQDTIYDNILDMKMASSTVRDETVTTALSLLRKKRLLLL